MTADDADEGTDAADTGADGDAGTTTVDPSAAGDGRGLLGRALAELPAVVVAFLAGVAGVAGSYALAGFTRAWMVAPLNTFLSYNMPDFAIRFAITVLGNLGQKLSLFTAVLIGVGILGATAYLAMVVDRRVEVPGAATLFAVWFALPVPYFLTGAVLPAASAAAGVGIVVGVSSLAGHDTSTATSGVDPERRRVVGGLASAVGVSILGGLLGRRSIAGPSVAGAGEPLAELDYVGVQEGIDTAEIDELLAQADENDLDVDGIEGLVSEDFYEVDINAVNPAVKPEGWTLTVTGEVENDLELTYQDLLERETENRFNTLRCVGEGLNGYKTDNALWTGTPVMSLLEEANPQGEYVELVAADDYREGFPLEALRDGLLAFGMNGDTLPQGHGYPVRALVPGHWGEINVKWLTEIRVTKENPGGYWEERGWHGTGPVKTVAKIHHQDVGADEIEVGGRAYAGTRGVSAVEVSTDGGETWNEAELSARLPDDDVLRQWVYRYPNPGESHEVVARAVDDNGTVQPEEKTDPFPSGPSGWVSKTVDG